MNLIKSIFALSLIGLSMHVYAYPIKIQCSDRIVEYDDHVLKMLNSNVITGYIIINDFSQNKLLNEQKFIKLPIDSKEFAFMMSMAVKTDAQIFSLIDSLDEQGFQLVSFYTQLLQTHRISSLLKYKIFKNPKLQQLAKLSDDQIKDFIYNKYFVYWNDYSQKEALFNKYLDSNRNEICHEIFRSCTANSFYAFLVLIDFYQQVMKKPLPLTTDHLKNVFYAQSYDIQQTLLNKKLVILP